MCTSFVLYSDKTYIGMNLDISERPIALSLKGRDQFLVLQKEGPSFYPAFGLNRSGAFMNLLMVESNEAGKYRRGKDCVHIMRIFEGVLGGLIGPDALETLLREKTVVNVPSISVHSMVTGKDRYACIIEPGRTNIHLNSSRSFLVLTNFPLSDFAESDYCAVEGAGADRHKTCYRMLLESQGAFRIDRGLAILEATAQVTGDWPTQFSMLAVPEDECLYFTLKRNYQKRYRFSFVDHVVQTDQGFARQQGHILDKKGTLLSELEQW